MVKTEGEIKKSSAPDWNRRLQRLLLFEIVAAVVGLVLFYGYLVSAPRLVLRGVTITSGPRALAPPEKALPPPSAAEVPTPHRPPVAGSPGADKPAPEPEVSAESLLSPSSRQAGAETHGQAGAGVRTSPPPENYPEKPPVFPGNANRTSATGGQAVGNSPSAAQAVSPARAGALPSSPGDRVRPDRVVSQASAADAAGEQARVPAASLVLEIGDFVLPDRVVAAEARLKKMGLVPKRMEKVVPTPMFRVYLGPFQQGRQALEVRSVARRLGDQPFLERRPSGYFVIVSSFYLEDNVEAWLRKYRRAGYQPGVVCEQLPLKHTLLLVDAAPTGEPAAVLLERLRRAGFTEARMHVSPIPKTTE